MPVPLRGGRHFYVASFALAAALEVATGSTLLYMGPVKWQAAPYDQLSLLEEPADEHRHLLQEVDPTDLSHVSRGAHRRAAARKPDSAGEATFAAPITRIGAGIGDERAAAQKPEDNGKVFSLARTGGWRSAASQPTFSSGTSVAIGCLAALALMESSPRFVLLISL